MKELPYAEDVGHYWKTGSSSPESWMEKTKKLITDMGGAILTEAYGSANGRAAYMLALKIAGETYKVVWPVLPVYYGSKEIDARRQAATMLYHDIKAKCMTAAVLGARAAFFSYLELPDGRVASEAATPELASCFPLQLKDGGH